MFSHLTRQIPRTSTLVIAVVIAAGCSGGTSDSTPNATSSGNPPATTVTAEDVVTPSSGATSDETAWVAGVVALGKKMLGPTSGEVTITPKYLRAEANRLRGCGAELTRLGPASERLQPVFTLAQQGCAKYEEAAKCFTAAKSNMDQASKCLTAVNKGSQLFSIAESTAESLKDANN